MRLCTTYPLVATNHAYFTNRSMHTAHEALMCISSGTYLTDDNRKQLTPEYFFKSSAEMVELFSDLPEAIENTVAIAQRCSVMSEERPPMLPKFPCTDDKNEADELKALSLAGLQKRLDIHVFKPHHTEQERVELSTLYYDRLHFELDVITKMKFPGYFLIVSDFIRWSKREGIPVGPGRGSGAGSVVAWSLEITDLDPIRFKLLFERFLNPERVSMPDFDIDFCQDRRDEVIRYVQNKYGADRVAQIITFGKLQARAVIRDVGRVMQLPYSLTDRICKMIPNNPAAPVTLQEAIDGDVELQRLKKDDEEIGQLLTIGLQLEGLYRHASTHAAGVVIADRPLSELVPLYSDPRSDILVVQYSMKYAESAGLVKFDFLGLKTLTVISQTCNIISQTEPGIDINISTIPLDDPKSYALLAEGDAVGVFQLESAGMRETLSKMKPDCFEDLIALISLYRPGPMDNIPTYIARKHGKEKPDYLHPLLTDILQETFGVIIYQEQVMQIAQVLAGYSLGGADLLRRAMGKKIKAEMDAQRALFVQGSLANNVPKDQASFIFDLVAKFAGYGFNKSHAAAYALISYQTAWLKANYPVEFITASMNLEIDDTDKLSTFYQEAKSHQMDVLPPDINHSNALFAVEKNKTNIKSIRYALGAIKGVGVQAMKAICTERGTNGPYASIFDFASRVDSKLLNKKILEGLIASGAFDQLHPNRHQLFAAIEMISAYANGKARDRDSQQFSLFDDAFGLEAQDITPPLPTVTDWPNMERMQMEFAAIGFFLSSHPLDHLLPLLKSKSVTLASAFDSNDDAPSGRVRLTGVIIQKKIRSSPRGKFAFVQLSDPSGLFEVSIFDEMLLRQATELLETGTSVYLNADVKKDDTGVRIIATDIQALDVLLQDFSVRAQITLTSAEDLPRLAQFLHTIKTGRSRITIRIPHLHHYLEYSLPSRFQLTPDHLEEMKQLQGIKHFSIA
ncbi:MAG: DNA polymerase III subunit alpha [Alphaproteobacteria bacterium]|nr:DNA polymerase III subunit alpha [Alphaproteobacteria bacterium]